MEEGESRQHMVLEKMDWNMQTNKIWPPHITMDRSTPENQRHVI